MGIYKNIVGWLLLVEIEEKLLPSNYPQGTSKWLTKKKKGETYKYEARDEKGKNWGGGGVEAYYKGRSKSKQNSWIQPVRACSQSKLYI